MRPEEAAKPATPRAVSRHRGGPAPTHGLTFFKRDVVSFKKPPQRCRAKALFVLFLQNGL